MGEVEKKAKKQHIIFYSFYFLQKKTHTTLCNGWLGFVLVEERSKVR